jgi:hypothetical protein
MDSFGFECGAGLRRPAGFQYGAKVWNDCLKESQYPKRPGPRNLS